MHDKIIFLKEHPVFQRLSDRYLQEITGYMEVVNLDADTILFREGDPAQHFYIVMEGTVGLYEGIACERGQLIQPIDVGEIIGWSWLVPPYQWAFSSKSQQGAMLMKFDAKALRELCERDPVFGYGTMKQICSLMLGRLHAVRSEMNKRIKELDPDL